MKSAMKILVLVLCALFVTVLSQDQHIELSFDKELKNETIENKKDYKYYKFSVASDNNRNKDISVRTSLTEEFPWANPDIYLSKTNEYPTFENSSIKCNSFGEDICTINMNELQAGDEWYIGVTCSSKYSRGSKCVYNIMLESIEELILTDGKPITVYLYKGQEKIFRYFVPNDTEIRHVQIASRGKDSFSKFEMLTVKGNDPPGTDRRRHSFPVWDNGWVSRFEPQCNCFCIDCNYTTMLQADSEGYYTVTAKTSKAIEIIKSGETYDNVFPKSTNCYNFYVSDPRFDLRIKMKVYGGDPDLYINPKTVPKKLTEFKYNSYETLESEELVISPGMREDDENIVGEYFICVYGRYTSSYRLDVRNDENYSNMLESGVSESGYLGYNEIHNYWYRDQALTDKTNITFQLHAMSGRIVLRYKQCPVGDDLTFAKENCSHNLEDLTKPIKNEKFFYGIGSETIEHDPSNCIVPATTSIRDKAPRCMYNVGVLGSAMNITSHYGATVRHQEFRHVIISEGEMIEGSIVQKQYNYYKISINDEDVTSLTIQVLAIHGDPDVYVSRNNSFPNVTDFEKKSSICGRFPDTIYYSINNETDNADLTGNYYIGVYGFIESTYHLYYHTERKVNGTDEKHKLPIRLSQNKPIRGILTNKNDYVRYKFTVNNITSNEEIFVKLVPQNGKFKFFTKYNELAENDHYDLSGDLANHYTVSYNPAKNKTYSKGTFYVYVQPVATEDLESTNMSYTFLMNFFIGSHHITLLNDQQTSGYTKNDDVNYYEYSYQNITDHIVLSLTRVNGDIETIVSLNHSISTPTNNDINEEYGVFSVYKENTTISKNDIDKFCTASQSRYCKMRIAIHAMNVSAESSYVLLAKAFTKEDHKIYKIENSIPIKGSLKKDEWVYYYFKTSNRKPVYAVTVPEGGDPNVYVSMEKNTSKRHSEWTLPTKEEYLKSSEDTMGADILMLSTEDIKNCSVSCILIFGVNAHTYASSYSLTVNRGIVLLRDKESHTDTLGTWGNYKFYDYYRSCKNCTTIISVNSLSNSLFNVFINFNTTDKVSSHQDPSSAEFVLSDRGSQQIKITPDDLISKNHSDSQGYFLIEVHSHSNLNYTISASSDVIEMTSISKGMWYSYSIHNESDFKTFIYKHHSSNKFFVTLQTDIGGYVEAYVNSVPKDANGDYSNYVPTKDNYTWSSYENTEDFTNTIIDTQNSNFCSDCYYLISLYSYEYTTGSIAVQEGGSHQGGSSVTTLKLGKPVKHDMGESYYAYYKFVVSDDQDIIVDVNVLSGTIEYKLTDYLLKEEDYNGTFEEDGKNGLIYSGYEPDLSYEFSSSNSYFKYGKAYYVTLYSYELFSRFIISVSHKGQYNHISDSTPLRVHLNKGKQFFYYTLNPEPGKTRIAIETFVRNREETFDLYAKLVNTKDVFENDTASDNPGWQLKYNDIVDNATKSIINSGERNDKLFTTITAYENDTFNDQVLLIAINPTKTPAHSMIDLYVSSSDVQPLEFGLVHSGYVENKKDKFKLYEVQVPKTKEYSYVVEATPCYGEIQMFISTTFRKLLDDEYEQKADHLNNGRLYSLLEPKNYSRRYMIAIKSINNQSSDYEDEQFSDFQIEARKYSKKAAHNTYIERYYIPNDGVISYEFTDEDEILVEWPRVYSGENKENLLPEDDVQYEVRINTEKYPGYDSLCYMSYIDDVPTDGAEPSYQLVSKNSTIINPDNFDKAEVLYITVFAYIDEGRNNDTYNENYYTMVYKSIKVNIEYLDYEEGGYLLYIMIALVIVLSLVICFFYRKYKRTKKKLDFEVREVRGPDGAQEMQPTAPRIYNRFHSVNEASGKPEI